ncbi:MAG: stage V sporulation protein AA [Lachnospiraceae bacterium]
MAAINETIYIKADKNVEVKTHNITLGDVLKIECSNQNVVAKVKTLKLLKFPDQKTGRQVVSILKVIECIHQSYPNIEVQSVGEADFIVTLECQKPQNKPVHLLKIAGVIITCFAGAAFSIMAFNNDVSTSKLFSQIYERLVGSPSDGFTILEVMYCLGLSIGILVFFNHFGKKRFTVDPTPVEVEMRLYENNIQTTLIETYARKEREVDVGTADTTGNRRT